MENFPLWADHIVAFLFGFFIPLYAAYRQPKDLAGQRFSSLQKKQFYLSTCFSLFVMAFIVVGVWLLFKRPLTGLGFALPVETSSWWWIVLVFVALYVADTGIAMATVANRGKTITRWKERTPFMPSQQSELPLYFLMCFCAGVFEEIIFRGFLVTYCLYLFSAWHNPELWAIILPAVVFSVAHYYQGSKAVIKILVFSLLFAFIFIRSGSLLIVMLLHFIIDAVGGMLTMHYLKEDEKPNDPETASLGENQTTEPE